MTTPERATGRAPEGGSGPAVVIVVAGDAVRAGRLAAELERAGARVAVFDPGDPAPAPAEAAAAVLELAAEVFGRP